MFWIRERRERYAGEFLIRCEPRLCYKFFRLHFFALNVAFVRNEPKIMSWPTFHKRPASEGVIFKFPKCVGFVDGYEFRPFCSENDKTQKNA